MNKNVALKVFCHSYWLAIQHGSHRLAWQFAVEQVTSALSEWYVDEDREIIAHGQRIFTWITHVTAQCY